METATHWSGTVTLETAIRLEAMVLTTALVALKSLPWLLLEIGSVPNDFDLLPNAFGLDKRFPLDELGRVSKPVAENKDSNETDDDDDDDDEEENDDEDSDDEDDSGDNEDEDDDDDDEGSSDDEGETNGDGGTDDDDDDDDDSDEDDEDDDDDSDDEEEEPNLPHFKKTK